MQILHCHSHQFSAHIFDWEGRHNTNIRGTKGVTKAQAEFANEAFSLFRWDIPMVAKSGQDGTSASHELSKDFSFCMPFHIGMGRMWRMSRGRWQEEE